MEINLDCIPCLQRQALQALRFVNNDNQLHERVLREVMKTLLQVKWASTPPEMAHEVHKIVRRLTKENDPYAQVKKESNNLVRKMYSALKKTVVASKNPLRTAIRLAIAGNIIDFGALREFNLEETITEVVEKEFAIDDYEELRIKLKNARTLLFFVDNAGEIGLDRLLVETMLEEKELEKIWFVVKGGPIINDATIDDAVYMGLDELPNVKFRTVSNGEIDTGPERSSDTVRRWIEEADLVISKGQGNYEGLSEYNGVFFLLMVKCPIIASELGVIEKDIVLRYKS